MKGNNSLRPLVAVSAAPFEEAKFYSYAEIAEGANIPISQIRRDALRRKLPVHSLGYRSKRVLGLHVLQYLGIAVRAR